MIKTAGCCQRAAEEAGARSRERAVCWTRVSFGRGCWSRGQEKPTILYYHSTFGTAGPDVDALGCLGGVGFARPLKLEDWFPSSLTTWVKPIRRSEQCTDALHPPARSNHGSTSTFASCGSSSRRRTRPPPTPTSTARPSSPTPPPTSPPNSPSSSAKPACSTTAAVSPRRAQSTTSSATSPKSTRTSASSHCASPFPLVRSLRINL